MPSENFARVHSHEEHLRREALAVLKGNSKLQLHIAVTEAAMDLADVYRQWDTTDEDLRVTQFLGMRVTNAFCSSLKLLLSGYGQNAALIQRDILETIFLLDLFSSHRHLIEQWRCADQKAFRRDFKPVKVREMLDKRDGNTNKKRAEMYEMFSILAGHPNMNSPLMMRPQKGGDIFVGPFIEATALEAGIGEMGRLAVQFGESMAAFLPSDNPVFVETKSYFAGLKTHWWQTFYPNRARSKVHPATEGTG